MCIPAVLFVGLVVAVLATFDDMKVRDIPSLSRHQHLTLLPSTR